LVAQSVEHEDEAYEVARMTEVKARRLEKSRTVPNNSDSKKRFNF